MTHKDVLIRKLKNDLEHSRKQQQDTARELRECELSIVRLQGQIGKLQDEQSLKRSDVAAKDHTLRAMEQQNLDSKVKVSFGENFTNLVKVIVRLQVHLEIGFTLQVIFESPFKIARALRRVQLEVIYKYHERSYEY